MRGLEVVRVWVLGSEIERWDKLGVMVTWLAGEVRVAMVPGVAGFHRGRKEGGLTGEGEME
ncbi:hypothetical protein C1H46_007247 [Malus baccata]|uniref:Uncharacterized protein n=1 Tax=Malus baccata TaxID=106549 RepID=A0A540N802_MALBA|nr:hypothetical protein C1H46_007247 [Malus baccata]